MTDLTETRARILLEKPWPLPLPNGPQGKPRRVGVEIELAGLTEAQRGAISVSKSRIVMMQRQPSAVAT